MTDKEMMSLCLGAPFALFGLLMLFAGEFGSSLTGFFWFAIIMAATEERR
jgi:hypothetical protein